MGLVLLELGLYLAAALPYCGRFKFSSFHAAATLVAIVATALLHAVSPPAAAVAPAHAPPSNVLGTCAAAGDAASAGVRCLRMRDAHGAVVEFHEGAVWRPLYLAGAAMAVLVVDICWSSIDWSRRAAPARVRE